MCPGKTHQLFHLQKSLLVEGSLEKLGKTQ